MVFDNSDEVLATVLKRPLNEDERRDVLSESHSSGDYLVEVCKAIESFYGVDKQLFSIAKRNLSHLLKGNSDTWGLQQNCLNCFLLVNESWAQDFFAKNVSSINKSWLSIILATSIGRNADLAVTTYNLNHHSLTDDQRSLYQKYLIGQRVGASFSALQKDQDLKITSRKKLFSDPLKIAICVSGQLRGYEEAKKSWDSIFQGHDVDYYVHTWSE